MSDFERLAETAGIALPAELRRLLAEGRTRYGNSREDWSKGWREYTLSAQPALSCAYDFEWIDGQQAGDVIEEWLDPAYQDGRRFLPFAQSGAGDAYCLTPLQDGQVGVALVWHDRESSEVENLSFAGFAYRLLVESAQDIEHLLDDDWAFDDARHCVIANLQLMENCLPEPFKAGLKQLVAQVQQAHANPHALITAEQARVALAVVPEPVAERFSVTARWECGQG